MEVRSAVYAGNGLTLPRQALEHGIRHGTTPPHRQPSEMKLAEVGNGQFHGAVASQQTGMVVAGNA